MFSDGGVTSPDIWIVISITIIALISLLLNPLVFRHNLRKKSSIARDLYMALSTTDFITSLVMSTVFSEGILSPKEEQCFEDHNDTFCQTSYYRYNRTATAAEKGIGSLAWSLGFIPLVLAVVLSLTRWYQIALPLRSLEKRTVRVALIAAISVSVAYMVWIMFTDTSEKVMSMSMQLTRVPTTGNKFQYWISLTGTVALILILVSNTASVLTIWNIVKSETFQGNVEMRARKIRGSVRILLLNAGNVVWAGLLVVRSLTNKQSEAQVIQQMVTSILPMLLSSYNPTVYVGLTEGIFKKNSS